MDLDSICAKIFNGKYALTKDGTDKIVVNCLLPWTLLQKLRANNDDLPAEQDLLCGIKTCNIPGTFVIIYAVLVTPVVPPPPPQQPDGPIVNADAVDEPEGEPTPVAVAEVPERQFRYFIVDVRTMFDPDVKKMWKRFYIIWAKSYPENIQFNLDGLVRRQNEHDQNNQNN